MVDHAEDDRAAIRDMALAFARERRTFGRRHEEHQAVQFRLADMATDLEAAPALLHRAARALDAGAPDAARLCTMAKRFVTDAASTVADEALQLRGGYGYLGDHGVEKIVRDLRLHRTLEGTNETMRPIVARSVPAGGR